MCIRDSKKIVTWLVRELAEQVGGRLFDIGLQQDPSLLHETEEAEAQRRQDEALLAQLERAERALLAADAPHTAVVLGEQLEPNIPYRVD